MTDQTWRLQAACAGTDYEMWFSEGKTAREALEICNGSRNNAPCPVRDQCLADALGEKLQYGIRGGKTAPQRELLLKRTRGTKPLAPCGTPSAYTRHVRRGEPIDDACRAAHTAQRAADTAARRAREMAS